MKKITKLFLALIMLASTSVFAQQEVEMADTMRSEGKIYVVVAIMLIIFIGVAIYLFMVDRKVSALEKKLPGKKS